MKATTGYSDSHSNRTPFRSLRRLVWNCNNGPCEFVGSNVRPIPRIGWHLPCREYGICVAISTRTLANDRLHLRSIPVVSYISFRWLHATNLPSSVYLDENIIAVLNFGHWSLFEDIWFAVLFQQLGIHRLRHPGSRHGLFSGQREARIITSLFRPTTIGACNLNLLNSISVGYLD